MKPFDLVVYLLPAVVACSSSSGGTASTGASGVASDKPLAQLTADESSRLCDWSLDVEGGPGSVTDCGNGRSRQTHTKDECLEDIRTIGKLVTTCTITVRDAEDCSLETGKDTCGSTKPACDRINACAKSASK